MSLSRQTVIDFKCVAAMSTILMSSRTSGFGSTSTKNLPAFKSSYNIAPCVTTHLYL
jgi:hypothetical protein